MAPRPMRARALVALAGAACALLAPALPASGAEVVSEAKAAFIQSGDAICNAGASRLAARVVAYESRKQGGSSASRKVATPRDVERYVTEVAADEIERQIKELALLTPPKGDEATVKKLLDAARSALTALRKNPGRAAFDDPFKSVREQFVAYGFDRCASRDLTVDTKAK